jgi:hypothetical protein
MSALEIKIGRNFQTDAACIRCLQVGYAAGTSRQPSLPFIPRHDSAPQSKICLLSEVVGGKRVFSLFDPLKGRGPNVAQADGTSGKWSLSAGRLPSNGFIERAPDHRARAQFFLKARLR